MPIARQHEKGKKKTQPNFIIPNKKQCSKISLTNLLCFNKNITRLPQPRWWNTRLLNHG